MRSTLFATEVGEYNCDIAFVKEDRLNEIEIKSSFQDFKKDFEKVKHESYSNNHNNKTWCPNYFWFLVPQALRDKVLPFVTNSKYGLLIYRDLDVDAHKRIHVQKQPQLISEYEVAKFVKMGILERMGNELISRHTAG
jgi:hypothetical protein